MKKYLLFIFCIAPSFSLSLVFNPSTSNLSIFAQPEQLKLSFFTHIHTNYSFKTSASSWIEADVIADMRTSFFHPSLNFGLQSSLGSQGFLFHAIGQWVPYPDFDYQPAVGILANISTGISSSGHVYQFSYLQLLLGKTFPIDHGLIKSVTPYFIPLVQLETFSFSFNWYAIAGFYIQHSQRNPLHSPIFTAFEGRYNRSHISIHWHLLLPF